jgi:hypothetical protein
MNSLTIANAQLQHQKERPAKRVTYNPVTGLTDQVPAMPLDVALSSSSTNPVQNRAISEAVIDLTNKASHNAAGIEHNAGDISLLNERTNNNAIAIQHNANDIAELDTKTNALAATIANVSEDMETVNSDMAALDDKVDTFSDAIEQNTIDIQKNKRDIQHNADEIAKVEEEISDVSEILVTVREHTVEIAALDDKVNTNTADIATNTTAISDEVTRATAAEQQLASDIGNKQNTLVSGTNIKTINNASLLDTGNLSLDATSLNIDNTASTPTTISSALSEKQSKELSSSISVGGTAQTTVEGCLSALASSSGPASLSVYPDYDRLDFGSYGTVTKYTSYTSLSAGVYLLYLSFDRDVSNSDNNSVTMEITCPNTYDDVGSVTLKTLNGENSSSLGYHKIRLCTPILIRVTSTTNHRLTVVLNAPTQSQGAYRYWRFYRRYIKLA